MRNTYLIDFENVGSEGLNGVATLTAEDRVILFYSANSNRMTVRAHQAIVASPAHFDYFEVAVGGKNALDHQLGTYLGYLVATNASERYFIVSHDNGFKFLSTFWLAQDPSLQISMCDNIKVSLRVRPTERPRPVNKPEQHVEQKAEPKSEPKQEPKAELQPEPKPEPVAEQPVAEVQPEPQPEPAVEVEPEPVVEEPAVEPVAEPQPEPVVEVKPEPVAEAPVELKPAGPLPALGSQSRSRSNPQRGRVRSESILATLKQPKPVETPVVEAPPAVEPVEEPKAEPVVETSAAVEEPTVEIQPVAEVEAPAVEEAAAEVAETPEAPAKSSRNRRRRTRSNRKEQKPEEAKPEELKAEEAKPEEPKSEPVMAEVPKPEKQEEPKPQKKQKPEKAEKPEKTEAAEPKPYVLSDAASAALTTLLQEHPKVNEARIRELIAGSKKQVLCNTLRRQLGQEQGLALYNQIKKLAWK